MPRLDHDGADRRVRPGGPEAAPAERQGEAHEGGVVAHGRAARRRWRRVGLRLLRRGIRPGAHGAQAVAEGAEQVLEILGLAEILVDRGEAHVGDVVEALQPLHHQLADRLGGDLGLAARSRAGG